MSTLDVRSSSLSHGGEQPATSESATAIQARPRIAGTIFLCGLIALTLLIWQSTALIPTAVVLPLAIFLTACYCGLGSLLWNGVVRFTELNRRELNGLLSRQLRNSKRLSILDPDTALLQRWYFELRIAEEISRCLRYGSSMAIALIRTPADSHPGSALRPGAAELPPIFSNMIRSVDLATRLTDREYVFCLPQTTEEGASAALSRLVGKYAASLEVGLVVCPRDAQDWQGLLLKASRGAQALQLQEPERLPTDRHQKYLALSEKVNSEPAGEIALAPGESAKGLKLSLRHASKRVGVALRIWEVDGVVYFERVPAIADTAAA